MPRFLAKCLAFLLIQTALLGILLLRYTASDSDNYLAETVVKNRNLRETGPGKLVLVGGSSAAFGFWSDHLAEELRRPVVNLGLAAGLGVEYMLAEVRPALRRGDLIILSLEYDHFARGPRAGRWSGQGFDPNLLQQVIVFRPQSIRCLSPTHFRKIILDRGFLLLGGIARRGAWAWRLSLDATPFPPEAPVRGFNRWGDFTRHRTPEALAQRTPIVDARLVGDPRGFPNLGVCRQLASFAEEAGAQGATVAWSFPPRPAAMLERQSDLAERLDQALAAIPGLVKLDTPGDHAYAPDLFFDSANHLTGPGARLRTERLIEALRQKFPP